MGRIGFGLYAAAFDLVEPLWSLYRELHGILGSAKAERFATRLESLAFYSWAFAP